MNKNEKVFLIQNAKKATSIEWSSNVVTLKLKLYLSNQRQYKKKSMVKSSGTYK